MAAPGRRGPAGCGTVAGLVARRRRAILPRGGHAPAGAVQTSAPRADQAGQRPGQAPPVVDRERPQRSGGIDPGDVEDVLGADASDAVERDQQARGGSSPPRAGGAASTARPAPIAAARGRVAARRRLSAARSLRDGLGLGQRDERLGGHGGGLRALGGRARSGAPTTIRQGAPPDRPCGRQGPRETPDRARPAPAGTAVGPGERGASARRARPPAGRCQTAAGRAARRRRRRA